MKIEEAYRLLGITTEDGSRTAKMKSRRLISRYHPDAVGSESPEHLARAQRLNEAYQLVKKVIREKESHENYGQSRSGMQRYKVNHHAFTERKIYSAYHMDARHLSEEEQKMAKELYQTVASGRFYWDPYEEAFEMFLKSVHHATIQLLKQVEERCEKSCIDRGTFRKNRWIFEEDQLAELRLPYQLRLFQSLASQFVRPVECLRKLAESTHIDEQDREIYCFRAFAGAKGQRGIEKNIRNLKSGDKIYADALKDNRILVSDGQGRPLGALSLEMDDLYFCLIPLLKNHKAHVKMIVDKVRDSRAEIQFFFRLEELEESYEIPNENEKMTQILSFYEKLLTSKYEQ